jgi:hypothetical protein
VLFASICINAQQILNLNKYFRASVSPSAAGINEQLILNSNLSYSSLGTHNNNSTIVGFDKKYELNIATSSYLKMSNWGLWSDYSFINSFVTRVNVSDKSYLQLGISPELQWVSNNLINPYREEYNDPTFLENQQANQTLTNISIGITFQSPFFFIDLAALRIVSTPIGTEKLYKQTPLFLANTGVNFPLGDDFECKPTILFQFMSKPFLYSADAGLALWFKESIGISYDAILTTNQYNDGLSHRVSLDIRSLDRLQVNFGYIFGNSLLYQNSQGTYEVGLKYDLKRSKSNNPKNLID